jgi:hypothetical protein
MYLLDTLTDVYNLAASADIYDGYAGGLSGYRGWIVVNINMGDVTNPLTGTTGTFTCEARTANEQRLLGQTTVFVSSPGGEASFAFRFFCDFSLQEEDGQGITIKLQSSVAGDTAAAVTVNIFAEGTQTASDFDSTAQSALKATAVGLTTQGKADVQAAMTSQGVTTGRAALLDNLDAAITSREASGAASAAASALESHGDSEWATATGFAVAGDAMTLAAGAIVAGSFGAGVLPTNFAAQVISAAGVVRATNTADAALATASALAAVAAKTSLITTAGLHVLGAVTGGRLQVVRGDTYSAATGGTLAVTIPDYAGPDVDGATLDLGIGPAPDGTPASAEGTAVATMSGADLVLAITLDLADANLDPSAEYIFTLSRDYEGGDKRTVVVGWAEVLADVPATST